MAWLKPYRAVVNFNLDCIIFKKIDDFSIPFKIYTQAHPYIRRITLDQPVTLLPGQTAWVQTNYKDLPRDRSFAFVASHIAAVSIFIDLLMPRFIQLYNALLKAITLPWKTCVSQIQESYKSGYFISL